MIALIITFILKIINILIYLKIVKSFVLCENIL